MNELASFQDAQESLSSINSRKFLYRQQVFSMTEVQEKVRMRSHNVCKLPDKNITKWGKIPTLPTGNIHKPFIVHKLFFLIIVKRRMVMKPKHIKQTQTRSYFFSVLLIL